MNLKGIKAEDLESVVDVTSDLPKNGIEELLKASGYTRGESPRIEELEYVIVAILLRYNVIAIILRYILKPIYRRMLENGLC